MIATTFNKLEHNISFSKCNDNSQYSKWKTHGTGECIWYHHAHKYIHANPILINNFAFGSKINFFQLICDYTLQFQYMRARSMQKMWNASKIVATKKPTGPRRTNDGVIPARTSHINDKIDLLFYQLKKNANSWRVNLFKCVSNCLWLSYVAKTKLIENM